MRLGFGPVFVYECITLARRWQLYATRVFFVGALLTALVTVWLGQLHGRRLASIGRDAEAGEKFFYGVVGTELTLVLLGRRLHRRGGAPVFRDARDLRSATGPYARTD